MVIQLATAQPAAGALEGRWGGDQLQLTLDRNGGRLEMDCASGTILGPVKQDADGRFAATGTFERHRPGPQRANGSAVTQAQYTGEVKDGSMKLSILVAGAGAVQVFQLRYGASVKLVRCF